MLQQIVIDLVQIIRDYFKVNIFLGILTFLFFYFLENKKEMQEKNWKKGICLTAFVIYAAFLVELTLLTREAGSRVGVSLRFWETYQDNLYAKCWMVENLLLMIPFGILLPMLSKRFHSFWKILLIGLTLSVGIESIQLLTEKGFFQLDDIWLNTAGAAVGYGISWMCSKWGVGTIVSGAFFVWLSMIIFGFSAQTGNESSGISDRLAGLVSDFLNRKMGFVVEQERLTFPIRKLAHMTEYALLWLSSYSMFWFGWKYQEKQLSRRGNLGSILLVFCVSVSDEIHQLFVPGRSGQFVDVCWDMAGVGLCILFFRVILCLCRTEKT